VIVRVSVIVTVRVAVIVRVRVLVAVRVVRVARGVDLAAGSLADAAREQHVDLRRGERAALDAPGAQRDALEAERRDDVLERGEREARVDERAEAHVARGAGGHVEERDRALRGHGLPAPDSAPSAA
jgi:hypothetical protein